MDRAVYWQVRVTDERSGAVDRGSEKLDLFKTPPCIITCHLRIQWCLRPPNDMHSQQASKQTWLVVVLVGDGPTLHTCQSVLPLSYLFKNKQQQEQHEEDCNTEKKGIVL